jgi:tetratricopeptide (TPR) repeat protein
VRDGSQIWGGQYRRRLPDAHALQEEIAREISEKLFVKLTPGQNARLGRSNTDDWEAYHLYLKALTIDGNLAEAHTSLAAIKEFFDWDFAGAESAYRQAISLNPNSALGHQRYATYLSRAGRWREALEELRLSQMTDPLPGLINFKFGLILYYARRCERAPELCRETLELNPLFGEPYVIGGLALVKMGRYEEAVESALEARGLMPDSLEGLANLGYVYGAAGKRDRAFEVLAELHEMSQHRYLPHHMTALVSNGRAVAARLKARASSEC